MTKPKIPHKVDIAFELQALASHLQQTWNVGLEVMQVLQDMSRDIQRYNRDWYDWKMINEWKKDLIDQRQKHLQQKWGDKHKNDMNYVDMPLVYLQSMVWLDLENELNKTNVEAYRKVFHTKGMYQEYKKKYSWLQRLKPNGWNDQNVTSDSQETILENQYAAFRGHIKTFANRPDVIQALDVGYMKDYAPDSIPTDFCIAVAHHIDALHRHNNSVDFIHAMTDMGIHDKSEYPIFDDAFETSHPLLKIIQEHIRNNMFFRISNIQRPEVQTTIANFLHDPTHIKSIFEALLPYTDMRKKSNADNDLVEQLNRAYAEMHAQEKGATP